ncbi:dTDP-D-glucose 4-6-dehydratase isoform X1 [Brachionus plicatilis]|uniref:dTDP-D-glucose 4,6-dehydratase n=1 Tax=Brachionus plicatilis TaxID=10195 RepID=A0A3M7RET2_BRAPC|nr:dTDP-D-glucose 4-6-dehydratase isoform X1 [Brachionus plicatilis]
MDLINGQASNRQAILGDCFLLRWEKKTSQYETCTSFESHLNKVKIVHTESNVLNGLNFSSNSDQFVSCVYGQVYFVIVDLRPDSPAYFKSKWLKLSSCQISQIFIPAFYAFGYFSSTNSILHFTQNSNIDIYGLNIEDKNLNLSIPFSNYLQSEQDLAKPGLEKIHQLLSEHKINEVYRKIVSYPNGLSHLSSFDKKVLVTGGAGFIGSHVAILLTQKYPTYQIVVLDKLEECANMKNLSEIKNLSNFYFIKGDICNFEELKKIFSQFKFEYVVHFAAQTHVDISLVFPLKFSKTNVLGTHYLLECCRLHGIQKFVHVSTDEVYGTTDKVANINQPLEPTNPYACSKLAAENIIKAYQKCYKLPIVITRGNNAYGPHQYVEKVIPKFITRLLKNKKCCIYENCDAKEKYIEVVRGRLLNDERYRIDSSKLIQLGWKPRVDFDDGLIRTIEWYRENQNYWKNGDQVIDLFCEKITPDLKN